MRCIMTFTATQELVFQVNKYSSAEKKNTYKVKFFSDETAQHNHQTWPTKLKLISTHESAISKQSVIDIYSLNCDLPVSSGTTLLNKGKAKKINKELCTIPREFYEHDKPEPSQVMMVLDIKIKEHGYDNKEAIASKEAAFLALFSQEKPPVYILKFQSMGLQYIFMEGSIKADLLGNHFFNDEDEHHLKTHSADFCQLVEFLINALKRGESVTIKKEGMTLHHFKAEDYIKKISPGIADYQPAHTSYTIYPNQYYDIATQGSYTKAMQASGLFKVSTASHESSKIVLMQTEKMEGVFHV